MISKWIQNDTKMDPNWYQNESKMMTESEVYPADRCTDAMFERSELLGGGSRGRDDGKRGLSGGPLHLCMFERSELLGC